MTSDVTAVTADGATSGAPCVRPGRSQAVCAHGERRGSPARHPHRRRGVCARVPTYGLTDVIDPGGNTGEVSFLTRRTSVRHACAVPPVSQANTRDPYATRPCLRTAHRTSKGRLIVRHWPVPSSGRDPYIAGHGFIEATLSQRAWGRGRPVDPPVSAAAWGLDEVARGAPTGCVGRRLRVYPAAGVS